MESIFLGGLYITIGIIYFWVIQFKTISCYKKYLTYRFLLVCLFLWPFLLCTYLVKTIIEDFK
jgi:hypothetical protein